jgi:hypothetical protein
VRTAILAALGVSFPQALPTHDELDAALAAVIAAAADGKVPGATVRRVGMPLQLANRILREGQILVLELDAQATARVANGVAVALGPEPPPPVHRASRAGGSHTGMLALVVTSAMINAQSPNAQGPQIAVSGVSHLKANKTNRLRIRLLPNGETLWLGDHTTFCKAHQQGDPQAKRDYDMLYNQLAANRDQAVDCAYEVV